MPKHLHEGELAYLFLYIRLLAEVKNHSATTSKGISTDTSL
jgi:hypothetical protein